MRKKLYFLFYQCGDNPHVIHHIVPSCQAVPDPDLQTADHPAAAAGAHRAHRVGLPDRSCGPGALHHRLPSFLQGVYSLPQTR
jgi:hypothetical protein